MTTTTTGGARHGAQLLGAYWLDAPDQAHGEHCLCGGPLRVQERAPGLFKGVGLRGRVLMLTLATASIVAAALALSL
ncbi:hypothetical protein ABZ953_10525 [Streptomyces sp. NPDC046465]|uniref:hypothetical protein n=1 Tax=Streptomyces sp. NPDC046465 TaxID=3155810 RepID=UPI0033DE5878